jgi:hypothetical protein
MIPNPWCSAFPAMLLLREVVHEFMLVLFGRVDDSWDHSMQHPSRPLPVLVLEERAGKE